jgi:protein TonB
MKTKKNPQLEIGRNSSIYFAIGLNLMLLLSWRALEYKTYEKTDYVMDIVNVDQQLEEDIPLINANTPPPPPPPVAIQESIQIVEDVEEIEETVIVEEVEEEVEVAFAIIEDVPVYPGCEGLSKEQTKACFQAKIQEHVKRNFEYPESALQLGIQGRVSVVFVVDSKGFTTNIRSRGPDKILEKEAERIIGLLPKMQPGKQRGKPVKVAYAVPIFFKYAEQ